MDLIIATLIFGPLIALAFSPSDNETDNGECVEKPGENKADIESDEEVSEEQRREIYRFSICVQGIMVLVIVIGLILRGLGFLFSSD